MGLNSADRRILLLGASLILGTLAACDGRSESIGSSLPAGSVALNPNTGLAFVVADNKGGSASDLFLQGAVWGRLVDIYDFDCGTGIRVLRFRDFLIGSNVIDDDDIDITDVSCGDDVDFQISRNAITAVEELTIAHPFGGTEFTRVLRNLESGVQPILDKGLSATELPPFTAIPRNAAIALQFSDLLDDGGDPGTAGYPKLVNSETVQLMVGYPPTAVQDARILPDPNYGDIVSGNFHTNRVLLDLAVSETEALAIGQAANLSGLPPSSTTVQPNVVIRVPTIVNASATQFQILRNLGGTPLNFGGNGSSDPFSPTFDVVRAFRSGGPTDVTGDLFNGFLRDNVAPEILGSQPITVTAVAPIGGGQFLADFTFASAACASAPRDGDVITLAGPVVVEVLVDVAGAGPSFLSVPTRILAGQDFVPGFAEYQTTWDPGLGLPPECFVTFAPAPLAPPASLVPSDTTITVGFTEPMDPTSVDAFESFLVTYFPEPANVLTRNIVGRIVPNQDLTEFTFSPLVPFRTANGFADEFRIDLVTGTTADGNQGFTDLAGNEIETPLGQLGFTLDDTEPTLNSGSIALTFDNLGSDNTSTFIDDDGNDLPDLRGQFLPQTSRGTIVPRPVSRFSADVDPSQVLGTVPLMVRAPVGVTTNAPLTRHGSKVHAVWRYHDMGMFLLDDDTLNIDVEGLAWAPFGSAGVLFDTFPEFAMSIGHSHYLPDEGLDAMSGAPLAPNSGLVATFAENILDEDAAPLTPVHLRDEGYTVQPLDGYLSDTGTLLAPWPMNRGKPISQYRLFTFRDTTLDVRAGPGSTADTSVANSGGVSSGQVWSANNIPPAGLPLLMEFRTYEATSFASGLNLLAHSYANRLGLPVNPLHQPFALPYFRAHSTGGVLGNGVFDNVDPDQELVARGGIDALGAPTPPNDNLFYHGSVDFIRRQNVVHTFWIDTGGTNSFVDFTVYPTEQPLGTSVTLAFRGATGVSSTSGQAWTNTNNMDPYGDPRVSNVIGGGPAFQVNYLNGDRTWKSNISQISGSRFVQVRMTMISNIESQVSPEVAAIGFSYFR